MVGDGSGQRASAPSGVACAGWGNEREAEAAAHEQPPAHPPAAPVKQAHRCGRMDEAERSSSEPVHRVFEGLRTLDPVTGQVLYLLSLTTSPDGALKGRVLVSKLACMEDA